MFENDAAKQFVLFPILRKKENAQRVCVRVTLAVQNYTHQYIIERDII
jgi:hypothetical protein